MCASAGKNASIDSSESVMSSGVPKVVTVDMKANSPDSWRRRSGTTISPGPGWVAGTPRIVARVGLQLGQQRAQLRILRDADLAPQPPQDVGAPLRQVGDPRRHALGMQAQAQRVDGRLQQVRGGAGRDQPDAGVAVDELPAAIDRDRRRGLVGGEQATDDLADLAHLGILERRLGIGGRVAGGQQQLVALPQRHVEMLGELDHHVAARLGAAGLDEAEMARGDLGLQRQLHLAETPLVAPAAQQRADAQGRRRR